VHREQEKGEGGPSALFLRRHAICSAALAVGAETRGRARRY